MSLKKIMLLVIAISIVMSLAAVASAAAAKKPAAAAQTANAESVGVVDRGQILDNHPGLAAARQKLADIARQKENEAKAAADKETDTAKKAQAVQAKRMELNRN